MSDTFTIGQFIDAIEKNGLPQGVGSLWKTPNHKELSTNGSRLCSYEWDTYTGTEYDFNVAIGAACAMGQGYINIGGLAGYIDDNYVNGLWSEFMSYVVNLNDREGRDLKQIAKAAREDYSEHLNLEIPLDKFDFTPYLPKGFKHD